MDRYKDLKTIDYKNHITYGRSKKFKFLDIPTTDNSIRNYKVQSGQEGRPDLIANAVYGDPRLCWVLIEYNKVVDMFGWPKSGTIIKYPQESVVLPELV